MFPSQSISPNLADGRKVLRLNNSRPSAVTPSIIIIEILIALLSLVESEGGGLIRNEQLLTTNVRFPLLFLALIPICVMEMQPDFMSC